MFEWIPKRFKKPAAKPRKKQEGSRESVIAYCILCNFAEIAPRHDFSGIIKKDELIAFSKAASEANEKRVAESGSMPASELTGEVAVG